MGRIIGQKEAGFLHLDDKEKSCFISGAFRPNQFLDMLYTPFGGRIREFTDPFLFQSDPFHFQKSPFFTRFQIKIEPGIPENNLPLHHFRPADPREAEGAIP